jgi:hypothetical protein
MLRTKGNSLIVNTAVHLIQHASSAMLDTFISSAVYRVIGVNT